MTLPVTERIILQPLTLRSPFTWIALAWGDLRQAPGLSLAHGLAVTLFATLLLWFAGDRFWLLAGAFSGFLLVAPVLAVGLYAISHALERNTQPSLGLIGQTWLSWRGQARHDWRLVLFGVLLGLAGTGWVVVSAALMTVFSPQPIEHPMDFILHVLAARNGYLFELWLALGAVLAAPIFASSVITIPLMLDREIALLQAVLTSWRLVVEHPCTMALWAALIASLTLLAVLALMLGFVLVVPLLGHATWHAYRQAVDVSALPPRIRGPE